MNRVAVTIVDVMAFLVPGVVLLFALALFPWRDASLAPLNESLLHRIPLLNTPWAAATCWILAAYVLGFLLRLTSIELMNILTSRSWVGRVETEARQLALPLEVGIHDEKLITALNAIASNANKRGVSRHAPYFHFSKRITRTHPALWSEAERLEAEVRLCAGLFVPFLVLLLDGTFRLMLGQAGFVVLLIGLAGAGIVFLAFPARRVKEVQYDHLLALVAMRPHGNPKSEETNDQRFV